VTTTPDPKIIAREPAYWHGFGINVTEDLRPAPNVEKLLLADETETYGCAQGGCEYRHETVRGVIAHQGAHSSKGKGTTRYADEVIAKVAELREIERAKSVRGWPERVAVRLNRLGLTTLLGNPWLAKDVSSLSSRYPGSPPPELVLTPDSHAWTSTEGLTRRETADHRPQKKAGTFAEEPMTNRERALRIGSNLGQARELIEEIERLHAVFSGCDHDDYDEVKAKANQWDQLKSLIRQGE
jgi:hypothetical protein